MTKALMTDALAAANPEQFTSPATRLPLDGVRRVVREAIHPSHFLVSDRLTLQWEGPIDETVVWEVFQGRLLDASQTRAQQAFESWNVHQVEARGRSAEPILSVKLDRSAGRLHVVRAIHCHAWEAYDAGDNVILSRETQKWARELVGTVDLTASASADRLRGSLTGLLFQAVVGTSRLPLTSVEGPLPAFTLGDLAYFAHLDQRSTWVTTAHDLIDCGLTASCSVREKAKLLEALVRFIVPEELAASAQQFLGRWRQLGLSPADLPALLRTVFNEVALSPYTDFVDKALAFVGHLVAAGGLTVAAQVDFLSFLLRHLARHLTAYDLVVFHHRGANYPDALLLDAVLRAYLGLAERHPGLFLQHAEDEKEDANRKRIRRRAARMGILLRWQYEGHPVPDLPTSPGENLRVLPAPFGRVPEEQIVEPTRRGRRLFAAEPVTLTQIGQTLLRQSIDDLEDAAELRELGTALFLDRPLGIRKRPGEPDGTLLFSYIAFSPSIAERRLAFLAERLDDSGLRDHAQRLRASTFAGLAIQPSGLPPRPGVVSLDDALRVASDFVLLGTTRQTLADFQAAYDTAALGIDGLLKSTQLIVPSANRPGKRPGQLCFFDQSGQQREVEIAALEAQCNNVAISHRQHCT
jgi:hypothetical protein